MISRDIKIYAKWGKNGKRTRLNQLQDGLTTLKKSTKFQYNELKKANEAKANQTDAEIATLKRQNEAIV